MLEMMQFEYEVGYGCLIFPFYWDFQTLIQPINGWHVDIVLLLGIGLQDSNLCFQETRVIEEKNKVWLPKACSKIRVQDSNLYFHETRVIEGNNKIWLPKTCSRILLRDSNLCFQETRLTEGKDRVWIPKMYFRICFWDSNFFSRKQEWQKNRVWIMKVYSRFNTPQRFKFWFENSAFFQLSFFLQSPKITPKAPKKGQVWSA